MTARIHVVLPRPRPPSRHDLAGLGVGVLGLAVLTALLAPFRDRLGLLNTGLLLLLLVVLVAAQFGWLTALVTSVLANVCLNFFFVEPYHTLTVKEPSNALGLVVFLVVAAVTSGLLTRARAGEERAVQHQAETAALYELSHLVSSIPETATALDAICDRILSTFEVSSGAILLPSPSRPALLASRGLLDGAYQTVDERQAAARAVESKQAVALGRLPGRRGPRIVGLTGRTAPVAYLPMHAGGEVVGVLRVVGRMEASIFTRDALRLLQAFADEAGLAVERGRLLQEAARVQALEEADRLKSALLAAVSHDLRTPLAAIKAAASSLLQPAISWDDATRHEFLEAIDEETDRLTALVGNLLDLSRLQGGALRPERDWYDVRELVETAVGRAGPRLSGHGVSVTVADDVGDARLDYVQVTQVLTNLLENAAKFSPPGTPISVAATRDGERVRISVEDAGPGIPAAERESIFEPFQRAASARRVPGTGLGLAICRGLVEAHGGKIWAEDATVGTGARFVFEIPSPIAPAPRREPALTP